MSTPYTNRTIGLLDPSLGSANDGDQIIRAGVLAALDRLGVSSDSLVHLTTRRWLTRSERSMASSLSRIFVGGTNLLSSNMPWYRQWKVGTRNNHVFANRTVLLGVGWWQYQADPNMYTTRLLRRVLGGQVHSVRDGYTQQRLAALGIDAINTGCPTMWALPARPESRQTAGDQVVVTLTDYSREPTKDRYLLLRLVETYDRVRAWPQGAKDSSYIRTLCPGVEILEPGLDSFTNSLSVPGTDYVGTRLHAGILALQRGVRSTVIAVDNRAREIARDTGLPTIDRDDLSAEWGIVTDDRDVLLHIRHDEIDRWLLSAQKSLAALQ